MEREFNFSEFTINQISDTDKTANSSFGDKETKELLYLYNSALCKKNNFI